MARSFHNIEKLPGKSHRTGYAPLSGVWHVTGSTGDYYARCRTDRAAGLGAFFARTLADVSRELESR